MRGWLDRLKARPAFWSSVFFFLLLPWVPLGAELGATAEVRSSSLQIFVALYGLGLGASSRDEVKFGFGVFVGVVFSIAYGIILATEQPGGAGMSGGFSSGLWWWVTLFVGVALFIMHAAERYNRHVFDEEPFFRFFV